MLSIFTWDPEMPYEPEVVDEDVLSTFAGTRNEQVASLHSRAFFRYPLTFLLRTTDHDAMRAFFFARRGRVGRFYFRDRTLYQRTGIALTPTSDGATLSFALPTPGSGEYGGDFPISNAALRLYRAAVANGGVLTADTDARTITTTIAPAAGGAAMTADYEFYRKVRFESNRWSSSFISQAGVYRVRLSLVEVPK